jgi:glycosyltransferase involved in cell wall biosynthesis
VRVAQIASICFAVPPRSHGGTEIAIDLLTRGLVERGHDVTLFASGDSRTPAKLRAVVPRATQDDPSSTDYLEREMEVRNVAEAYATARDFDVLHSHWPTPAAYFSTTARTPSVMTYAYIDRGLHEYYRSHFPNLHTVCVSEAQNRMLGGGNPVIRYGIDVDRVPFSASGGDYLITVGRLVPHKGADRAIEIAARAGLPLVIVGDVTPYLEESAPYFESRVRPRVDGTRVRLSRSLPNAEVLALLAGARAFLFPISWEEPFGLVVAEALAAGTPVVATPRGSLPELVEDGVTGFLAESDETLAAAVARVREIDRRRCRREAEARFGYRRMAADYEAFYRKIAGA